MKTGFLKTMGLTAWAAGLLLLPAPTPAPASDLVEIVRVSTSKPYLLSGASSGAMPYVDRKATLTTLSPGVSQGVLVRTANKDAKVKTPEHLTLRVNRDAGVYVCYDPRAKRLPAWLDAPEWSPAPETVSTTEKGGSPMRVFFQRVAAGMEITLGGNHQGGNTGAKINYFVVVQPEEAPVCRPEAVFFVTPSVITAGEPVTLSWTSTHADTVEINRGIGFLPASGSMVLYPTQSLSYTFIATGPGGRVIIHDAVMVNPAFPARIIEPNGDQDVADVGFTIRWTAPKPADDTRVWLYYDLDPVGADGVLIVADLDASVNSYRWNTSGLAEGVYWVYAATHRGTSDPEVAYSPGPVTVNHDLFYETKLTVEDPKPALHFGNSVAISNDYAIIGADRHEGYQNRYRSVYVFKRCGSSWVEQIELTPPGGAANDGFGESLAISGDRLIIGAFGDDEKADNSGAAYIFQREGEAWVQQAKLTPSTALANIRFGLAVALEGDAAVVGAPYFLDGYVYIFTREDDQWVQQARLSLGATSQFGHAVGISGDRVLVGDPFGYKNNGYPGGVAHVYKREGSAWVHESELITLDSTGRTEFGCAVAISGDYAIVGASEDQEAGSRAGAAYIFRREGSGWKQQVKLIPDGSPEYKNFGCSVALEGDAAIVGNHSSYGTVYVYKRIGESWVETGRLRVNDQEPYGGFGKRVALGAGFAIVGFKGDDAVELNAGSAHIHPIPKAGLSAEPAMILKGESTTLSWVSTHAQSCAIEPGIGGVAANGSTTTWPAQTTTYTLTAVNPNAADMDSVTVIVLEPSEPPSVEIWANPGAVTAGEASTLSWRSTDAGDVSLNQGIGAVDLNGSMVVSPAQTTTYTITAQGPGGTATACVTVAVTYPPPHCQFHLTPGTIHQGESATLTWSATWADYCILEPGVGRVEPEGTLTASPQRSTWYTLAVHGPGGSITRSIQLVVVIPPSLTASAAPTSIAEGQPVTLTWDSDQASSVVIDQGIGEAPLFGSIQVWPRETTTYTFTAFTPSSSVQEQVTVVVWPKPRVVLTADPATLRAGESTVLSWEATNADTCLLEPGGGVVDAVGALAATPDKTRTYTLTATGPGGTAQAGATVTVLHPPTAHITPTPETVTIGEWAVLAWSCDNADSCLIEPGIGLVSPDGTVSVRPWETTRYTLTAAGPGGTSVSTTTVAVTRPFPGATLEADRESLAPGEPVLLTWHSENADACVLEPGGESVELAGSTTVWPRETTTYTLRCAQGQGVAATAGVNLFVTEHPYAYGDPTPAEQAHLEAINRARSDPHQEAARLGIDLFEGALPGTITGDPAPPLASNALLIQAARLHSQDMVLNGYLGHFSPDGRSPRDRVEDAGYQPLTVGENLANHCSNDPVDEGVAAAAMHDVLFVDAGIAGRGHRVNLLHPDFSQVGVGIGSGCDEDFPYGFVVTDNFSAPDADGRFFLLGVVYHDQDHDGGYTPGEGVGGVKVEILETGAKTRTASAGGYGIGLEPGTYTVSAALPDGRRAERPVSIVDQNVKIDFTLDDFVRPAPEVFLDADPRVVRAGHSTTLTWSAPLAGVATLDNGIGIVPANGRITVRPTQTTTYTAQAAGPYGDAAASLTVWVSDFSSLPTAAFSAEPETVHPGGSSVLSWTCGDAQRVFIEPGVGEVPPVGSQAVRPKHTTTYTLTATSPAGTVRSRVTLRVPGRPAPLPEGSFGKPYEDLIPPDAVIAAYDPERFSIVTGLVSDLDRAPLSGVSVTVFDHPEYGSAHTDPSGRFAIPVEGGQTVVLVYEKEGLLPSQRQVAVPWNDIAISETIQMIPEDPAATTITFDGNPGTVVTHRSTPVNDQAGARACTLVFQGDNRAHLLDEKGNRVQHLTTIRARATEYRTPGSMPARLPPTSAYTYCVELAVDGVGQVAFEKPVVAWVDNFPGFEVGVRVPSGYYDRGKNVWAPSRDGLVVRLLDTDRDGVVDALDADGDGLADDLDGDGDVKDEVAGLADPHRYPPGATYFRVEVTHFTAYDWNFPALASLLAEPADWLIDWPADVFTQRFQDCQRRTNSFVEERSQIFHEDMAIPGTDMTLHYASNRTRGWKTVITAPASGGRVPEGVKRIIVTLDVAGRSLEQVLAPEPDQTAEFVWDGLDFRARPVEGTVTARVGVGWVYDAVYLESGLLEMSFGTVGARVTRAPARDEVVAWRRSELSIRKAPGRGGLPGEGWSLSALHDPDPKDPAVLHKGDGLPVDNRTRLISTVAGTGAPGFDGDGGPATRARLFRPTSVAFDPSGNLYIAGQGVGSVRKVDRNGAITTIAGGPAGVSDADHIPATRARLYTPCSIGFDRSGNLYIADDGGHRVRKIDPDGIITTVAGTGEAGCDGDGGPAIRAKITPTGLAIDTFGSIYVADRNAYRVRRIDPNGTIHTVAGTGEYGHSGDGGPATQARLTQPFSVAVDDRGSLYIAGAGRVRKVGPDGIISTVAGTGELGRGGDGGPATSAQIGATYQVALDRSGNFYFSQVYADTECVRKVDPGGIITTVAGLGETGYSGDGGPALPAGLNHPRDLAFDPEGNLYIPDCYNHAVRKVSMGKAAAAGRFVEENGPGYVFSGSGRHEKTIDPETGVVLREFGYDETDRLAHITDRFGNRVVIERDAGGNPTAIVSPDGIRTGLTLDENNHLTRVTHPDGGVYGFEYTPDGLLTAKIEPSGNRFEHTFDPRGRLVRTTDAEGGDWRFSRQVSFDGDVVCRTTTGQGNTTTYLDRTDSTGGFTSTITDPSGDRTLYTRSGDGLGVERSSPCGVELGLAYAVDPRFGFTYPGQIIERTPAGLERVWQRQKTYEDADSDNVVDRIGETVTINHRTVESTLDLAEATRSVTSAEGRTITTTYDPDTLLTQRVIAPGLHEVEYAHDARGRLTSVAAGSRQTDYTYDAQGFLGAVTDPENRTTFFSHDPAGRMTRVSRPDGTEVRFEYDANGNMTVLTNPVEVDHEFGFNQVNRNDSYHPPLSGATRYEYDSDRRLVRKLLPSGKSLEKIYDKTRLVQVLTPEATIDYTYGCGGNVGSISKGAESIVYAYDGALPISETFTGALDQTIRYTRDNDFAVSSVAYAGQEVELTYDNDGLLTGAGGFTITRNPQNGLPESVAGAGVELSRSFNGCGELDGVGFSVGGRAPYSWRLTRDNAGRITEKSETLLGEIAAYSYTYDALGRLLSVFRDGSLVEQYGYDANGARVYETNTLRGISGKSFAYSEEDHLLVAGDASYTYDADGFLTSRTRGAETTTYRYSTRGELLRVELADGRIVEHLTDPLGRRIAKKLDGVIVEKYLWQGLTRLLAVYDGLDNLVMRFEYADERMPVAMTKGGVGYFLGFDPVGSLRLVVDGAGNVVKAIDYDAFGNITGDSNPGFWVPLGFAGGLFDPDTGLIRFGFRDYDPDTGRWTAKDPIGFAGGDTDLYGYCLNDPVNAVDPMGLELSDIFPGIRKAVTMGVRGGAGAVAKTSRATAGIAVHGHPLAQTALGIAFVSEAGPLVGVAAIPASPFIISAAYHAAPYSESIVDFVFGWFTSTGAPKGWGYLSSGIKYAYETVKTLVSQPRVDACENK